MEYPCKECLVVSTCKLPGKSNQMLDTCENYISINIYEWRHGIKSSVNESICPCCGNKLNQPIFHLGAEVYNCSFCTYWYFDYK